MVTAGNEYLPGQRIRQDNLIDAQILYQKTVASNHFHIYNHFVSGPFKDSKSDIFEGGHRVPFIIRWSARVKAGEVCDQLVCTLDFLKTFAEMLNHELPTSAGEDSYSFLSLILGGDNYESRPELVHEAWHKDSLAIRKGDWKLIPFRNSGSNSRFPDVPEQGQLYNLGDDPVESVNLYDRYPDVAEQLKRSLDSIRKSTVSTEISLLNE